MNMFWWYWFQRGGLFRSIHKSPLRGHLDSKTWSDSNTIKNGKQDYEERDNGWDDGDNNTTWTD